MASVRAAAANCTEFAEEPPRQVNPNFDAARYRERNVIERCVGRLKQWRAVATRYDKRALNYRAAVVVAALLHWLSA